LEPLERREMLTGPGESSPEGIYYNDNLLIISGSQYYDLAIVRFTSAGLEATLENTHDLSTVQKVYPKWAVHKIRFFGNDGDDVFLNETNIESEAYGGLGSDTLVGGSGRDTFYGDFNPSLSASLPGYGNDNLYGRGGDDTLEGGPGNDHILGAEGNDTLKGDDGEDELYGGDAVDTILGGYGNDLVSGGQGNDNIDGGAGHDHLWGGPGHDTIFGRDGHDWLFGDSGDDTLIGGYGWDELYGDRGPIPNGGKRPVDYDSLPAGTDGNDKLHGGAWADNLYGGGGNDVMFGGAGFDELFGGDGHDELHGGEGNDTLQGGNGHDLISGGDGTDTLSGNDGNDALDGGAGADYLHGGAGNDVLYGGFDLDPDFIVGFWGADLFLALSTTNHSEFFDLRPASEGDIALNLNQVWLDGLFGWAKKKDPWAYG
jgi:Ca2+-binding RTX toxin-like protein